MGDLGGSTPVGDRLARSIGLYRDLVPILDERVLAAELGDLPSNPVGAQLWCVIGARESYARAIAAGEWSGFSCSLTEPGDPAEVAEALARSADAVAQVLRSSGEYTAPQEGLLLDLLEHEAQHHGQLIRYLYGLRLPIPASWKSRYALD